MFFGLNKKQRKKMKIQWVLSVRKNLFPGFQQQRQHVGLEKGHLGNGPPTNITRYSTFKLGKEERMREIWV